MDSIRRYWTEWRLGFWLLGIGSALSIVAVLMLLFAYAFPSSWNGVASIRDGLPFPAVLVSGRPVASYADIAENVSGLRHFYESQDFSSIGMRVDFTTQDGRSRLKIREREIINRLVEDEIIRILSSEAGISVSRDDAFRMIRDSAKEQGGTEQAAGQNVERLYGWDLDRFVSEVALPGMYRERLEAYYQSDPSRFSEAREKIEAAQRTLADGRSFSDVVAEYSDGRTSATGGAMGWFLRDQLVESLREPAGTQQTGVPGDIVESQLGFHILLVNERRTDQQGEHVNVSQIFVKKRSFGEWLSERMRETDIRVLVPEYEWSEESAMVEFRDESLRRLEEEMIRKSEGDASFLF